MALDTTAVRVRTILNAGFVAAHGLEHVVASWSEVCAVCGGHPAQEPAECGNARCPSFPPAGDLPERP